MANGFYRSDDHQTEAERLTMESTILSWRNWVNAWTDPTLELAKTWYAVPSQDDPYFPIVGLVNDVWEKLELALKDENTLAFRVKLMRGRYVSLFLCLSNNESS